MNQRVRLVVAATLCALTLAGCKPTTIVAKDPDDEGTPANSHIALPPPVKSSAVYRCDDNSVVYVDFLADDKTANVRLGGESAPLTRLTAATAGEPFTGGGYQLDGAGSSVKFAAPHKKSVSCKS